MKNNDILNELKILFPNAKCELNYNKDYELLLATMLSAQTTDKRVNEVTKVLFNKEDALEKLNKLSLIEIEEYIKTIGMYKQKAKYFKSIVEEINKIGYVPNDRAYLECLPGVGRKTTNVVLSNIYNEPLIAVDTHVLRVSKRLGITSLSDDTIITEKKLMNYFEKKDWIYIHHALIMFGRYICMAKKPKCEVCPFNGKCKKI